MKPWLAALWILTLAAAFGLARWTGPGRAAPPPPVDSFRTGLEELDPLERTYQVSAFLRTLGPEQLAAAVEAFDAVQPRVSKEEVRLFMRAWTRLDAPAAFAWARAWPKPQWGQTLTAEALRGWAMQDGRAALAAFEALEDLPAQTELGLREAVLDGWMRSSDKQGVSEYIAAVPELQRRRRLAFLLAGVIALESEEAVIRWVEALPDDAPNDFKQAAFYRAVSTLARADPSLATTWLETHRTQPYSVGAMEGIALKWAQHHDPVELFDWLLSLPPVDGREAERADAIGGGFRIWLREEPDEAEAWLRSTVPDDAPDAVFDPAIGELARALAASSPSSAMEWTERIQDEPLRLKRTELVGRAWQRQDPEAFQAWLAKSDVPDELRESLLKSAARAARRRDAAPAAAVQPVEPR
jgi:hypothetical protein